MGIYTTNLEIDGVEDVPVSVQFDAVPFCRGRTDGRFGPKIEPDEPARIEIESVTLADGRNVTLTTNAERRLEEEIAEMLNEGFGD